MNLTSIAWTDRSLNYQAGCSHEGPECTFCYAEVMSARLARMPHAPSRYQDAVNGARRWSRELVFDAAAMDRGFEQLRAIRKPTKVFLGSMTDLFHERVEPSWLYGLAEHIRGLEASGAPVTLQLLTKRPERALHWQRQHFPAGLPALVWMGTTAGYQDGWTLRGKHLVQIQAAVRWVSCEPMLGPILPVPEHLQGIEWIVIGGESGPKARPFHVEAARDLASIAERYGVAVFVKQLGRRPEVHDADGTPRPLLLRHPKGEDPSEWPESLRYRQFPEAA